VQIGRQHAGLILHIVGNVLRLLVPVIFRSIQTRPGKRSRGTGKGFGPRLKDALLENVTSRNKSGKRVLSVPRFAGVYTSNVIAAEIWYPERYNYKDGLRSGTRSILTGFGMNLIREFIMASKAFNCTSIDACRVAVQRLDSSAEEGPHHEVSTGSDSDRVGPSYKHSQENLARTSLVTILWQRPGSDFMPPRSRCVD
jgi:hypothetical protein